MAFDAFLQIEGIPGDCTDDAHKGWIEILSYHHGVSQPIGGSRSSGGAATAGRVDHQDMTITKELDVATVPLHLQCCNGKHIPKITIELCRAGETKKPFMRYTLADVVISSVTPSGMASTNMPTENVAFNYGRIDWEYIETDPKSSAAGKTTPGYWDTIKNVGG